MKAHLGTYDLDDQKVGQSQAFSHSLDPNPSFELNPWVPSITS